MTIKRFRVILISTLLIGVIVLLYPQIKPIPSYNQRKLNYNWAAEHKLIAHAMGGYRQKSYTNSLEAFKENYQKGFRIFEVDLMFTAEGILVGLHDAQQQRPSYQQYCNLQQRAGLSIIELKSIRKLLEEYPDIFLVIDTKEKKLADIKALYSSLVDSLTISNQEILSRIIPQLYNPKMLKELETVYPFESYIFTLYRTNLNDVRVVKFCEANNIKVVTMSEARFNEDLIQKLSAEGIKSYLHTINKKQTAKKYRELGVYGFYTDYLKPSELK